MMHWFVKRRILIESALPDDVDALADIHADSFSHGWSNGDFTTFLGNDKYFCLIAREENWVTRRVLGFVLVRAIGDEAEIITIATRAKVRRSGIGRRLMDEAIRRLQFERSQRLFLEVDENNDAAITLYKRLRFQQISERKGYYKGHALGVGEVAKALVMQRDLA